VVGRVGSRVLSRCEVEPLFVTAMISSVASRGHKRQPFYGPLTNNADRPVLLTLSSGGRNYGIVVFGDDDFLFQVVCGGELRGGTLSGEMFSTSG